MASQKELTRESSYDRVTILLHWLTAVLVVALFALAESWDFLRHGSPLRKELHSIHISLGIVLALVMTVRLGWRVTRGRRLASVSAGLMAFAGKAVHHALYLLLAVQIVLGFLWRWAQAEAFMFFGLFPVQFATVKDRALSHILGDLHDVAAWSIIVLAGLHAAAVLMHHYVLRDGVLKRMLPERAISDFGG